jgi:hypothetical protein
MKERLVVAGGGAAGLGLAAIFHFAALSLQEKLSFLLLLPAGGAVIFVLLSGISLLETGLMLLALRRFAAQLPLRFLGAACALYVSFAGVYALGYALLAADARGIQLLSALAVVRVGTLVFIPIAQTKQTIFPAR